MLQSNLGSRPKQNLSKGGNAANKTFKQLHSVLPITGLIFLLTLEVSELIYFKISPASDKGNLACLILNLFFLIFQGLLISCWRRQLGTEKLLERLTIVLYGCILFTNIELFWIKASETVAAGIISSIYIGMIFPITFFVYRLEKWVMWIIPTIYFCICLWRSTDPDNRLFLAFLGILFVGLGISFIIVGEFVRAAINLIQDWERKVNSLDKQLSEFFLNESEDGFVLVDRSFRIKKSNLKFFEFFGQSEEISGAKLTQYLAEVSNLACFDEIKELAGKVSYQETPGNESVTKIPVRSPGAQTLQALVNILFEFSKELKNIKIGWNTEKNQPQFYKTSGILDKTNVIISFAFIQQDTGEDFILIKLAHRSNETDSSTSSLSVRDIASIIHDLRTPIYASTAMLQNAIEQSRVSQDIAEEIIIPSMNCNQRLLFIVNDILDLAQILEGKFRLSYQSVEIRKLLQEPIKLIDALAKIKNIHIFLEIKENVPVIVNTDPNRLIQIIYNLMGNSLKFTKEGHVKLTVSSADSKYIDFSVEDTGTGIKQDDLRKLFTAFEKLSELNENVLGVGLGLCISNSIASVLGKKITVKSEFGEGSTFYFSIINADIKSESSTTATSNAFLLPTYTYKSRRSKFESEEESEYKRQSRKFSEDIKKLAIDGRKESNEIEPGTINDSVSNKTFYCDYRPSLKDEQLVSRTGLEQNLIEAKQKIKKTLDLKRSDSDIPLLQIVDHSSMAVSQTFDCMCPQVILVDDDSFNLTMFDILMKSINVKGMRFGDGDDFLKYMVENKVSCDKCTGPYFILVDQYMPNKDGLATSKDYIEKCEMNNLPQIPIVGCSANVDEDWKKRMTDVGVKNFTHKPLNRQKIERLIEKYKSVKDTKQLLKIK